MTFLSRLSLANKNLVALATIAILLIGGFIIPQLKQELFPAITFPAVTVVVAYPGASPSIVERDVTIPVEQAIQGLKGIEKTTSYSNQGASILIISFEYGTDIDRAQQSLTQRIARIQNILPTNAVTPQTQAFSLTDQPIIQLAVSSDQDQQALAVALEQKIVPEIQAIDGVGTVNVTGVRDQVVTVTLDLDKMKANGISFDVLQRTLQANNIALPAGDVDANGKITPIKVGNTFASIDDLKNLTIGVKTPQTAGGGTGTGTPGTGTGASGGSGGGTGTGAPGGFNGSGNAQASADTTDQSQAVQAKPTPVKLKDIATIKEDLGPSTSLTRTNGKPSLGLSIVKTSGGNTVSVSQALKDKISDLEDQLGNGAKISVISDQAPTITKSINDLAREGLIGAGFAIFVILLFLFSVRSTLVTAVSIPLSIVIALIGLYVGNFTLNILTLGGLTIAVGRVVDDSIVVLENIYRHLQEGEEKSVAIPNAVREVAGAVTSSTLTTVAVFLPIAFTNGLVGELFRSFSVAVTVALLASLFVSLTIIPVLASWFLKAPKPGQKVHEHKESWLERGYVAIVRWVTGVWWQRTILLFVALVILVVSIGLTMRLQTNFLGSSGQSSYNVSLTLPPATSLSEADKAAVKVEQMIDGLDHVKVYQATVGSAGAFAALSGGGTNVASFAITTEEGTDQKAFEQTLRDNLKDLANLGTFTISAGQSGPSNSTLAVNVKAGNDKTLQDAAKQVRDAVATVSGLADVTSNLSTSTPQIDVNVDPAKAIQYGMTPFQVAQNVRLVYSGTTISHITINGSQRDVNLYIDGRTSKLDAIKNLVIPTTTGSAKVSDLATVKLVEGPTQITHVDAERTATINASITDTNVGAVSSKVQSKLNSLTLPRGVTVALGGVTSDQSSAFQSLGLAVGIAILLVYIIMVATFRSLLQPVILLISVLFASTGSILLLLVTNTPLGVAALIGFLMLVGIVVTNAIVLLDLVRQYRDKGYSAREAVIEGGRHRLRPILMTAIATVLALMPMALGLDGSSGGFISQPLAVVVIGGLTSSTLMTLILVPTLYVILESFRRNSGGRNEKAVDVVSEEATPVVAGTH